MATLRKGDFPTLDDVVADMKAEMLPAERSKWDEAQAASDAATERWVENHSSGEDLRTDATSMRPHLAYQIYTDATGQFRWHLSTANGDVIAIASEGYATEADCLAAIDIVKKSRSAPVLAA